MPETEKAYKVRVTMNFDCIVFVKPGEEIQDKISEIDIPENTQCKYSEDTFETVSDNYEHVPDYDHLTVEQKDAIRTAAIENYASGDGGDNVPGEAAARELFENDTIADCLESMSGGLQTLLDFDPETGQSWDGDETK